MAREIINTGATPNDGAGDPIRTAFTKTNNNFAELYALPRSTVPSTPQGSEGDRAGMYAYNAGFFYWCYGDYDGTSEIWARVAGSSF